LWFDTAYHAGAATGPYASETIQLCGTSSATPLNVSLGTAAEYAVVVSVPVSGGVVHASGDLSWNGSVATPFGIIPTAEYSLPGGWVWNISTEEPGTLPTVTNPSTTALLAFERSSC
jgi:hypothetical protein